MPLYFIALIPDAKPAEKIQKLKERIKEKFGAKHALKLPAHITLQIPFKLELEKEERLVQSLVDFSELQESFQVELSGFGAFPPRVIFVKIKNHQPLIILHQKLQDMLSENFKLTQREKIKEIHPHITLASRDLTKDNFFRAWEEFKEKEFHNSFLDKSYFLLKHNGKNWEIIKEFFFRA